MDGVVIDRAALVAVFPLEGTPYVTATGIPHDQVEDQVVRILGDLEATLPDVAASLDALWDQIIDAVPA
jgi:hypothetical protein